VKSIFNARNEGNDVMFITLWSNSELNMPFIHISHYKTPGLLTVEIVIELGNIFVVTGILIVVIQY